MYRRVERSPTDAVTLSQADVPATLADAYGLTHKVCDTDWLRWGGWKLGGTNAGSRVTFGVEQLYFGALDRTEIAIQPDRAPAFPLFELKGEVEIALRVDKTGKGHDAWCVALEMPSSPISNLAESGVNALVADRCAAGVLLLGPIRKERLPDLTQSRFVLEIDGKAADDSSLSSLTDTPEQLLHDFVRIAASLDFVVKPGDWVSTGGITACVPFTPGAHVRVLLDGNAILDFVTAQHD